jgi:glycosyltransferase involved in cell wall biosynthesis
MNEPPTNKRGDQRHTQPLVSIIINNFNYALYLAAAIESALAQDYRNLEVVVVDDGSTDNSRQIIANYGSRIKAIHKANDGQASALNAGFHASAGAIILFLDADDVLLPSAIENVAGYFDDPDVSSVRWPMWIINADGSRTGDTRPSMLPASLNLRERILEKGPSNFPSSPTSGNAWSRAFLERVLPIPKDDFRLCADDYLYNLAPAFGDVKTFAQPQSCYRIHGKNNYSSRSFNEKLDIELQGYERLCGALANTLRANGIDAEPAKWWQHSWFHRLERAIADIKQLVGSHDRFILVDGNEWDAAGAFDSCAVRPFIERNGFDWGPPANCECAIEQLEALRHAGEEYIVIGWPAFWWFETYPDFSKHLEQTSNCVFRNDDVAIFRLDRRPDSPASIDRSQMICK